VIRFAPAKINLGLHITQKRSDGFHELESIAVQIPFYDILEINLSGQESESTFTQTGLKIEGNPADNLVWKAMRLFFNQGIRGAVNIHLHKQIPSGAGLGGGSSDASGTLRLLNELYDKPLKQGRLHQLAAKLGSDCPLFLYDSASLMLGRGERIEPVDIRLSGFYLILLFPGFTISTKEAYARIQPKKAKHNLSELLSSAPETWKNNLINDFEEALFPVHPILGELKSELYKLGAVYASMSGSGSALYGLFRHKPENEKSLTRYITWSGWLI